MNDLIETQICNAEERLRVAILHSDVETLNELLAPELIMTNHFGQLLGKEDNLVAHQFGLLNLQVLIPYEQKIQPIGNVALVSVQMYLLGSYNDHILNGNFRSTHVWAFSSMGIWYVVAAHFSVVV